MLHYAVIPGVWKIIKLSKKQNYVLSESWFFYSNLFDDKPADIKVTSFQILGPGFCVFIQVFFCGRNENWGNRAPVMFVAVNFKWNHTTSVFLSFCFLSVFLLLEAAPEVCPGKAAVCLSVSDSLSSVWRACRSCALHRRLFLKDIFSSRLPKVMLHHEPWKSYMTANSGTIC